MLVACGFNSREKGEKKWSFLKIWGKEWSLKALGGEKEEEAMQD